MCQFALGHGGVVWEKWMKIHGSCPLDLVEMEAGKHRKYLEWKGLGHILSQEESRAVADGWPVIVLKPTSLTRYLLDNIEKYNFKKICLNLCCFYVLTKFSLPLTGSLMIPMLMRVCICVELIGKNQQIWLWILTGVKYKIKVQLWL